MSGIVWYEDGSAPTPSKIYLPIKSSKKYNGGSEEMGRQVMIIEIHRALYKGRFNHVWAGADASPPVRRADAFFDGTVFDPSLIFV